MSSKSELPPGWLSRESKSHPGKFFYYNKKTGLTTWEKPSNNKVVEKDEDVSQKKEEQTKKEAKTPKKRSKEKQSSMVPRAIWPSNNKVKNFIAPKKILPNVTVLNKKNCSLVADYGSASDSGEDEEKEGKKRKVSSRKEKEEKKKTSNSSEKKSNESGILPANIAREKVQVKWIQSFQEKKLPHLPLVEKPEKPEKPKKKTVKKGSKKSVKCQQTEEVIQPSKISTSTDSSKPKKLIKKKACQIDSQTLEEPHKLSETEASSLSTSQKGADSTKKKKIIKKKIIKKKIVKKKKETDSGFESKNDSCVLDVRDDSSLLVNSELQINNEYQNDISGIVETPILTFKNRVAEHFSSHDVFAFKDLTQPMEVDICQEEEAMVIDIEEVRKILICQPSDEVMGDLTGSISEDSTTLTNSSPKQMAYIILDTNILLTKSGLAMIEKIRDGFYSDVERSIFIVVPWVVMQELDALKSKARMNSTTAKHAQKAISFLFSCFDHKHPQIIGQSSREAIEQDPLLIVENNDDKILQCCMQFQKKYPYCTVVLFSNDKNLCNKSMINNINAYTQQSIEYGLKELSGKSEIDFNLNNSTNLPVVDKKLSDRPPDIFMSNKSRESIFATQIFSKLKDILEKLLTKVFETEMKLAYDEIWLDIIIRKPPWDLRDVLFCIKKHWIAVFGMMYDGNTKSMEAIYISLYDYFSSDKDPVKKTDQVLSLIRDACYVMKPLAAKSSPYQEDIGQNLKVLNILERICVEIISKTVDITKVKSIDEYLTRNTEEKVDYESENKSDPVIFNECIALNRFQKIWELLNHYCQGVEQAIQRDPSAEVCQQILTTLHHSIPVLESTYINFSRCLAMDMNKPCDTEAFNSLSNQLNILLTELDGHDNEPRVTYNHLQALFSIPDKREMLNNGLGQLENMIRGLRTYHSQLMGT